MSTGAGMSVAFIFPGQGSQFVGMGKPLADAFASARAVFDEVDAALGEKLTRIIWDGPADTLKLTENAQPALMAVSLATMRVLEAEAGVEIERDAQFVAGHSLGEYSALAAAGALSVSDTARLLRIRGRAMQNAVLVGSGAMAEAHLGAEAAVSLSNMSMSGPNAGPASVFVGTSTPEIGSNGGEDESSRKSRRPAMELPYGAAIALGGLAIAAMLLMRG